MENEIKVKRFPMTRVVAKSFAVGAVTVGASILAGVALIKVIESCDESRYPMSHQ